MSSGRNSKNFSALLTTSCQGHMLSAWPTVVGIDLGLLLEACLSGFFMQLAFYSPVSILSSMQGSHSVPTLVSHLCDGSVHIRYWEFFCVRDLSGFPVRSFIQSFMWTGTPRYLFCALGGSSSSASSLLLLKLFQLFRSFGWCLGLSDPPLPSLCVCGGWGEHFSKWTPKSVRLVHSLSVSFK